jgi:hypothetical protein
VPLGGDVRPHLGERSERPAEVRTREHQQTRAGPVKAFLDGDAHGEGESAASEAESAPETELLAECQ